MPVRPLWRFAASLAFVLPALATVGAAQCALQWQPGAAAAGPDGQVHCLVALPNGDAIAGGAFLVADHAIANRVARWDGTTWHALGSGTNGTVYAAAVLTTGDLVVGGQFTLAGGVSVNNLARWDGTAWHDLGGGTNGIVYALQALPGGELALAGNFTNAGAVATNRLARWTGGAFTTFGTQPTFTSARRALARTPNGDLFVGGAGGQALGLNRFDGTNWSTIGGNSSINATVFSLTATNSGEVFIGGSFSVQSFPTSPNLVRFDGAAIQPVGNGRPQPVYAMALDTAGNLVASFGSIGGSTELERWNGTAWTLLGDFPGTGAYAILQRNNSSLLVSTIVSPVGNPAEYSVLDWNGATYARAGAEKPPLVQTYAATTDGGMVAGGVFTAIGGTAANNVAHWNGSTWQPMGLGVSDTVTAVAVAPDGSVVVGGFFNTAGGAPANRIARWNGSTWATLGAGLTWPPHRIVVAANGDIWAAHNGAERLVRWDGSTWAITNLPLINNVYDLAVHPDGRVFAAGIFLPFGGPVVSVMQLANGTWTALPPHGTTPGSIDSIQVLANGDLALAGAFTLTGLGNHGVLVFQNGAWSPLGSGSPLFVAATTQLPNGDLLASQTFLQGNQVVGRIHRWDGATWTPLVDANSAITWMGASNRGELFASGVFTVIGGAVAATFAQSTPSCPASVVPFGAGCAGGAGSVTLATSDRPWTGATFTSEASGMTPLSLALHLIGIVPQVVPLPLGAPGCTLFVDPLITDVLLPNGGIAAAAVAIPDATSLVGIVLRTQIVGLELDAALSLVRTTSTNALLATIGAL